MGYTHYWRRTEAEIQPEDWERIVARVKPILKAHASVLEDVEVTDEMVFFNGQCETFVLARVAESVPWREGDYFDFCKTRGAEYDPVVVAVLLIAAHELRNAGIGFSWSSDGAWPEDHSQGIEVSGLGPEDLVGP